MNFKVNASSSAKEPTMTEIRVMDDAIQRTRTTSRSRTPVLTRTGKTDKIADQTTAARSEESSGRETTEAQFSSTRDLATRTARTARTTGSVQTEMSDLSRRTATGTGTIEMNDLERISATAPGPLVTSSLVTATSETDRCSLFVATSSQDPARTSQPTIELTLEAVTFSEQIVSWSPTSLH